MAQLKWKHKFEASTVLEVIVAMVVILVVLGLALTIYSNVMRQSTPARQIRARMLIKKALLTAQLNQEGVDEQTYSGWVVKSEWKSYKGNDRLIEIQVTVSDENGLKVAGSRQVVINSK